MLAAHRYTSFLYLKALTFLPTPKPYPLFHRFQLPTFSLPFCTNNTSDSTSFAVSYLVHNLGFSPQFASKLSSTYNIHFKTARKPDSVPTYELVYRFLQSHKDTIACMIGHPALFSDYSVPHNIKLLIQNGVADSNIAGLLKTWSRSFHKRGLLELVEELKDLGFNPATTNFGVALHAKLSVHKRLWEEKVDAFKKWGWSDEDIMKAFKKRPHNMLRSIDKINLVMGFWVYQLGWDAMAIGKTPYILSLSLEKTIIPSVAVVQFLLNKGLRKQNASLTYPFTEKLFLDMYIKRFKNESSCLLKLYEEQLNLAHNRDKTGMS